MNKTTSFKHIITGISTTLALVFLTTSVTLAAPPAGPIPQRLDVLMVGDRLVDISYNLGVLPKYMSVRTWLWPMSSKLKNASQLIGCPNFITNKNSKIVPQLIKEHKVNRIILEKSAIFSRYAPKADPTKVVEIIKTFPEVDIEIVDFTQGTVPAIRQIANLLDRTTEGEELIKRFESETAHAKSLLTNISKRVLILRGTYQKKTGKTFIQAEAPGGYTEKFLLKPLGCKNVAGAMAGTQTKTRKGHLFLRKLDNITKANPDVIILTGDAIAVQIALVKALKNNPSLKQVPAIKHRTIYSLPLHNGSGIIEYPAILTQWAQVLKDR